MTVYVDFLMDHGWVLHGRPTWSCHLLSDQDDVTELHEIAVKIGLKRQWFQSKPGSTPHYDLVPAKRTLAIAHGAIAIDTREEWVEKIRPIVRRYRARGQVVPADDQTRAG